MDNAMPLCAALDGVDDPAFGASHDGRSVAQHIRTATLVVAPRLARLCPLWSHEDIDAACWATACLLLDRHDPSRGTLTTFLSHALPHYVAREYQREKNVKRQNGGRPDKTVRSVDPQRLGGLYARGENHADDAMDLEAAIAQLPTATLRNAVNDHLRGIKHKHAAARDGVGRQAISVRLTTAINLLAEKTGNPSPGPLRPPARRRHQSSPHLTPAKGSLSLPGDRP